MDSYREVLIKSGLFFCYTVRELSPYSVYRFRIEVENTVGRSTSSWKNVTTAEDGGLFFLILSNLNCKNKTLQK